MTIFRATVWLVALSLLVGVMIYAVLHAEPVPPTPPESLVVSDFGMKIRHYEVRDNVHCFVATQGGLGIAMSCVEIKKPWAEST